MRYLVCGSCGWTARVRDADWNIRTWYEEATCGHCRSWRRVRIFESIGRARVYWSDELEWERREAEAIGEEPEWDYDECCFTLIERVLATRIDAPATAA